MIEKFFHFQVALGVMWLWRLGKTGGCATGAGLAGRIVPNNFHGARLDGEKRSLEENAKQRREQPRKYFLRNVEH